MLAYTIILYRKKAFRPHILYKLLYKCLRSSPTKIWNKIHNAGADFVKFCISILSENWENKFKRELKKIFACSAKRFVRYYHIYMYNCELTNYIHIFMLLMRFAFVAMKKMTRIEKHAQLYFENVIFHFVEYMWRVRW